METYLTPEFRRRVIEGERPVSDALTITVAKLNSQSVTLEFAIVGSKGEPFVLITDVAELRERDTLTVADIHKVFDVRVSSGSTGY